MTNCHGLYEIAFVSCHAGHMLGLSKTTATGKEKDLQCLTGAFQQIRLNV